MRRGIESRGRQPRSDEPGKRGDEAELAAKPGAASPRRSEPVVQRGREVVFVALRCVVLRRGSWNEHGRLHRDVEVIGNGPEALDGGLVADVAAGNACRPGIGSAASLVD